MQALGWVSSPRKWDWVRRVVVGVVVTGFCGQAFAAATTTTLAVTSAGVPVTTVAAGDVVTLKATVDSSGPVAPGTVNFCDASINSTCTGAAFLGTAQLLASGFPGTGSITLRLGAGTHSLSAVFVGTSSYDASNSSGHSLDVTAGIYGSATALSYYGAGGTYAFSAQVQGFAGRSALPSGTVQFLDIDNGNSVLASGSLSGSPFAYNFSLAGQVTSATGGGVFGSAAGDFNGDGIADLVTANQGDDTISILLGVGDGTFLPQHTETVGNGPIAVAVGDFNSDGILDVVATNAGDATGSISVLLGNGDGTFQAQQTYATGDGPDAVWVGDLNHDGILDIVTANGSTTTLSVLLGNSDGTFQTATDISVPPSPISVAAADLDGDGNLDLISVNLGTGTISVMKGNGDGSFQGNADYPVGDGPGGLVIADFDSDGKLDLATTNFSDDTTSILRGKGDGSFLPQYTVEAPSFPYWIEGADFDGDGNVDLAVVGTGTNVLSISLGNGDGTFQARRETAVGNFPEWVTVTDLNGDGLPDLAVPNSNDATLSSFINTSGYVAEGTGSVSGLASIIGHNIKATYAGDSSFTPSESDPVTLGSNLVNTSLTLSSNQSPALSGSTVTITATLSPYTAAGQTTDGQTVEFFADTVDVGPATLSHGIATYTTSVLAVGSHSFSANYAGNTFVSAAASTTFTQEIAGPNSTTLDVLSGATPVTTAAVGTVITLKATVLGDSGAVTAGTVKFCDSSINSGCTGSALVGTAQIQSSGVAVLTTRLGIGIHHLSAAFSGTASHTASVSGDHSLEITGGSFSSSTDINFYGTNGDYAFQALVQGPAGRAVFPSGTVDFIDTDDTDNVLASGPLSGTPFSYRFSLTNADTPDTGAGVYGSAAGDFNGDGIPDLVTANSSDDTISLLLGNGDGSFQTETSYTVGNGPTGVAVGDFNGDGKLDVVATNANGPSGSISVLLGNGDGTFQTQQTYSTGRGPDSAWIADLNHDGKLDIVTANGNARNLSVLLGNGDGTFQTATSVSVGRTPLTVAAADFDGDGNLDLISANADDDNISFLKGNGDGTFQAKVNYSAGGEPAGLAVADFNSDGKLDIATANFDDDTVSILLGNGDGTFQAQSTIDAPFIPYWVDTADFNGDGKADLAVAGYGSDVVSISLGNGDGTFQTRQESFTGTSPDWVTIADFNGDGLPDLALPNSDDDTISILTNTSGYLVEATGSVSGLVSIVGHNVKASYGGDLLFAPSESSTVTLGSNTFATALTLSSNLNPASTGDPVTITATLSPFNGAGKTTNGQTVEFFLDSVSQGTKVLSSGIATYTTSALTAGSHVFTATYTGDTFFDGSVSDPFTENVASATTTTLTILNGVTPVTTAPLGTVITLKALVQAGGSPATAGTVRFCDASVNAYCTDAALLGTAQLSGSGLATIKVRLSYGSHSLLAVLVDNSVFLSSSSAPPQSFTVTGLAPTITGLTDYGSNGSYYLYGTVSGIPVTGSPGAPTGTLNFLDTSNSNAVLASVALSSGTSAASPLFSVRPTVPTGNSPVGVALADLNHDGFLDTIVTNSDDDTVGVLLGNGDSTFQSQVTYSTAGAGFSLLVADFNGDGNLDVATANLDGDSISILLGNGDGTLQTEQHYSAGFGPQLMALGDFNRDGKLDIAAIDSDSPMQLVVLLGNGDGTFQTEQDSSLPANMSNIFAGDFTSDGTSDILLTDPLGGNLYVYASNGDGTFQPPITTTANFPFSAAIGDFNADGRLDVAGLDAFPGDEAIWIYPGNGDGTFQSPTEITLSVSPGNIFSGDLNADGKTDLFLITNNNQMLTLLNNGTGVSFPTQQAFPIGGGALFAALGDLNGDGRSEIVTANSDDNDVSVLLYSSGTTVTLPPTPVTVSGSPHLVIGRYSGDTNYSTSDSAAVDLTVDNFFADTLTIAADKIFVPTTGTVTYTVTLSPNSFNGNSTDGENVYLFDGATLIDPVGATLSGGVATFILNGSDLSPGAHSISANYPGDTYLIGNISSAVTSYFVAPTTTTLAVTDQSGSTPLTTATSGTAILLKATVVQGVTPVTTGSVTFCDAAISATCTGRAILGAAQMIAGGTASISVVLPIGPHSLKALFGTTQADEASTSSATAFTVTGNYGTVIDIGSSGTAGNYTLTGTLRANTTAILLPTGTISFVDVTNSNTTIASAPLSSAAKSTLLDLPIASSPSAGAGPLFTVATDLNGDGIPDIATTNDDDTTISVMLGLGDGTFAAQQTYDVGDEPTGIAVGDFDGDGFPDLAVTNTDDGTISVLLGNGDGTFGTQQTYLAGTAPQELIAVDLDNDGILDLAAADIANDVVLILRGNGDGSFTTPNAYFTGRGPVAVTAGDLNRDGILDLVVSNALDNNVSVLLGNADGTFQDQTTVTAGLHPDSTVLIDFNGDGKLDLAALNSISNSTGSIAVRLGNGDGTFQARVTYAVGGNSSQLLAVDLDGDGKLDLVDTNDHDDEISVLLGNGDGTFQAQQTFPTGSAPVGLAAADFNSDGRIDLIAANGFDDSISVLLNGSTFQQTVTVTGVTVPGSGVHQVLASYPGDTYFASADSSDISLNASKFTTSLTLGSSGTPSTAGNSVTLTATLSPFSGNGQSTNGQTITFKNGSTVLGTGTLASGVATLSLSTLPIGTNSLTAVYAGDTYFLGFTSSTFSQTVQLTSSIWIGNGNGTVSLFNTSGNPVSTLASGGIGMAFDSTGNAWSINASGTSLSQFGATGSVLQSSVTGGGLSSTTALAIDGNGSIWTVNGNNSISVFDNSGTAVTPASGYTGGSLSSPSSIAIDNAGNVWISNSGNNSVTEVIGGAAPVVTPTTTAVKNQQLGVKP